MARKSRTALEKELRKLRVKLASEQKIISDDSAHPNARKLARQHAADLTRQIAQLTRDLEGRWS